MAYLASLLVDVDEVAPWRTRADVLSSEGL